MDSKCILYIHCIKRLKCLLKMRSFVPTSSSSGADCAGAAADPHRLRGGGGLLPARAELPAPAAGASAAILTSISNINTLYISISILYT